MKLTENFAVLLIDMQEDFVRLLTPEERKRIIPNQIHVIRLCRMFKIPFVVFELEKRENGETIPELQRYLQEKKGWFLAIADKEANSAFEESNLHEVLQKMGIKNLFLMGINATYCIMDTAIDGKKNGYTVITSHDVISGIRYKNLHLSAPRLMKEAICLPSIQELGV